MDYGKIDSYLGLPERPNAKKNMVYGSMGPYAVVDYNLTLSRLQSRLQHIYHRQPYARVDFILQSGM